jgi:hypothetical protein
MMSAGMVGISRCLPLKSRFASRLSLGHGFLAVTWSGVFGVGAADQSRFSGFRWQSRALVTKGEAERFWYIRPA